MTRIKDQQRWYIVWSTLLVQALLIGGLMVTTHSGAAAAAAPVIGGGVFPVPDPSAIARDAARVPKLTPGFVGARITSSHTQTAPDGPLVFDTVKWDSGLWDASKPTRLTFTEGAICEVRAQITVLGTAYYGMPDDDIVLLVKRDGDPTGFVAGARKSDVRPEPAQVVNAATTDWFEANEYVEVFVTPVGLTIESNWPGRANLSPVLTVTCDEG